MRRAAALLSSLAAVLTLGGLAGCAEAGVGETDAYAIACPAVDSALGSGSVASRGTVAGLERIRDALDPATGTREFVDAAIQLLQSADASDLSPDARRLVVEGCAEHGHELRNLKN